MGSPLNSIRVGHLCMHWYWHGILGTRSLSPLFRINFLSVCTPHFQALLAVDMGLAMCVIDVRVGHACS